MNREEWLKEPVICASGVGFQLAKVLNDYGIKTVKDLIEYEDKSTQSGYPNNKTINNIYPALIKIIAKNKEIANSLEVFI